MTIPKKSTWNDYYNNEDQFRDKLRSICIPFPGWNVRKAKWERFTTDTTGFILQKSEYLPR